ncbi:unnamed protein product [Pleuronectes platessa]|uniref:Uncharacterized protein n=1 Tax=Pleuronectes platessa TaxID=8262 RepID=A0A9N7UM96_PLEPL|nr:unnamed protein product [Pleuronectes platessa]
MAPRKSSRHWLLCPVCMKTQESLSCHLRRSCLKESEESDREEVVEKAKSDVLDLLKTGRAFSYKVLSRIVSSSNPLKSLIVIGREANRKLTAGQKFVSRFCTGVASHVE